MNKRAKTGKIILIMIWVIIIGLIFSIRDEVTVEGILNYTPDNLLLAAAVMMLFFALKSISIVIYSGILYVVDGMLFPVPAAISLNIIGTVIMVSLPYVLGMKLGKSAVVYVTEKYPKVNAIKKIRSENDLFFTYLVRMVGRLPSDIVSLYMGAIQVNYKKYLAGSLLGMLPHIILFPIIGMSLTDIHSPTFKISVLLEILLIGGSVIGYVIYKKHTNSK